MRLDPDFLCGEMEARCAVNAVSVKQRHGGHAQLGACCYQSLGQGGAFEKAESRAGVKFDKQVLSTQYSVLRKWEGFN